LVESRLAAYGPLITLSGLSLRLFVGIKAAVARLVAMARTAATTYALLLLDLPAADSLHCRVYVCKALTHLEDIAYVFWGKRPDVVNFHDEVSTPFSHA
jgi:ABC-type sulfate/molybdate transport systems ATPase subunit